MPVINKMTSEEEALHKERIAAIEEKTGYPICGARNREYMPCKRPAGTGTDHLKVGRCYRHGGRNQSPASAAYKSGMNGQITYPGLKEEIERLSSDRDVFDLRDHIYLMEGIALMCLKTAKTTDDLMPIVKIADTATKAIQRLHEIEVGRKYVISVESFGNTIEKLVDIIHRHVPDPYTRTLISDEIMNMRVSTAPKSQIPAYEVDTDANTES